MARFRDRAAREREMRSVLEQWVRGGEPISQFAAREGLAAKTLYRWRKRLRIGDDRVRRGRPSTKASGSSGASALFAEVRRPTLTLHPPVGFEVVLADGTTVRVPERFEADALRRLLGVLGEC